MIAGIGQGYWIATALQMARGTAAIANGGDLHPLRLVEERRTGYDAPWVPLPGGSAPRITDNAAHLRAVQEGMEATIHGRGTATAMARGAPFRMAGKTGTAQRVSRRGSVSLDPRTLPYHLRHQALFAGYAPAEDPTIALVVVVEHGGYGGATAAPIARRIFDAWLLGTMPEVAPAGEDGEMPVVELFGNVVAGVVPGPGVEPLGAADPALAPAPESVE